ncbi:hypothetical protein BJ322DRAFT_1023073 [Thelephora terrestris]|uniref:Uncharacterized protein n=1 Tax=Thelephora terrestris TaxID=56493 RepID=A0A9P6HA18_9AGAM|nr:hypothetical protein BJ322DRAFT_1023073 [Thelephora terrestris]
MYLVGNDWANGFKTHNELTMYPLVRGSSPDDTDMLAADSEAVTEVDSDEFLIVNGKRILSNSYDPRALKRNKAYSSFNEVRPTLHNKLSGLINNWPQVLTRTNPATHRQSSPRIPSTPSSVTRVLPATPSPLTSSWQQSPSSIISNVDPFDSITPTQNTDTPFLGHPSFPSHQAHQQSSNVIPQQKYKDEEGNFQTPGLKDLPFDIHNNFRDKFIRHIMELVCAGVTPWTNPLVPAYQHEFNLIYPGYHYRLHAKDTVVLPTNRELGVLRNQIGTKGLQAVIEFLPTQYTNRMLDSKAQRAAYVSTLLNSKQRPFIWEYFRPRTIEVPAGQEKYYDEKCRGLFQSIPVLRAFSVYFSSHGIRTRPEGSERPVGALALAAAAVKRGYLAHRSGDYVPTSKEFSTTNCLPQTEMYLEKIYGLTDDNWKGIFDALHRLQETSAHEDKIRAGVVLEQHEPLLPEDPPSPA